MAKRPTTKTVRVRRAKVTVYDVAREAGVSIATVSRALNAPDSVGKEMRDRVVKAAAMLDYTIDSVGKALRRQRTQIIATMLPRLDDPMFAIMASSIQETLSSNNYVGFVQTSGFNNKNLHNCAKKLIEKGAEGLIIFGKIEDNNLLNYIKSQNIPAVTLYSYYNDSQIPAFGFDNGAATEQLIELLVQLGHQRIAMISGPVDGNDRQAARVAVYQHAMHRIGSEPVVEFIDMSFELPDGAAALRRIIYHHPEVSALICNRDVIAFSVLAEAKKLGIRVPEQLSLTGFDDLDYAALFDPPLTTIAVPIEEMGRAAASSLIRHLDSGTPLSGMRFDTQVILRGSVSRPR